MFNLLVKGGGWNESADWLPDERVFEYTVPSLADRFRRRGEPPADAVRDLPTIFMPEIGGADEDARMGRIVRFRVGDKRVGLDYALEDHRIPLGEIQRLASELDIDRFEFNRTHWAIKDVDPSQRLRVECFRERYQ